MNTRTRSRRLGARSVWLDLPCLVHGFRDRPSHHQPPSCGSSFPPSEAIPTPCRSGIVERLRVVAASTVRHHDTLVVHRDHLLDFLVAMAGPHVRRWRCWSRRPSGRRTRPPHAPRSHRCAPPALAGPQSQRHSRGRLPSHPLCVTAESPDPVDPSGIIGDVSCPVSQAARPTFGPSPTIAALRIGSAGVGSTSFRTGIKVILTRAPYRCAIGIDDRN